MRKKIAKLHSLDDGVQQVLVMVPERKKVKEEYMMTAQSGMRRLCQEKGLKGQDWRVLMAYISTADYENYCFITQAEIAELLELPAQRVSESVKKLLDKQIMFHEDQFRGRKVYRLNAVYFWKGRLNKKYELAYEEHSEQLQLIS